MLFGPHARHALIAALASLPRLARAELFELREPEITAASAQALIGIGGVLAIGLVAFLFIRKRIGRRFSFSLRWLFVFCLACSMVVWGGARWHAAREQQGLRKDLGKRYSIDFREAALEDVIATLNIWMDQPCNLSYEIRDEAIYIFRPESSAKSVSSSTGP